jgi:hypothetical protein
VRHTILGAHIFTFFRFIRQEAKAHADTLEKRSANRSGYFG